MYEIEEECLSQYRKLLQLLDQDSEEIALGLQGELLDAYRAILIRERDTLMSALRSIQSII